MRARQPKRPRNRVQDQVLGKMAMNAFVVSDLAKSLRG
jgi:hypothetical protein